MKLINFFHYTELNTLREKMRANLNIRNSFNPYIHKIKEEKYLQITNSGLVSENKDWKEVGKLLVVDDLIIVLYIRDIFDLQHQKKEIYKNGYFDLRRFHISECQAIKTLKESNKKERFIYLQTEDDSGFIFNIKQGDEWKEYRKQKPLVCKYCLKNIGWKSENPQDFKLKDFFTKYGKFSGESFAQSPIYNAYFAPLQEYTSNFPELSKRYRESRDWKCEKCYFDCKHNSLRKYLHVHHKNGIKNQNEPSNLIALCIKCHSEEENHAHIKNEAMYKEFIAKNFQILGR